MAIVVQDSSATSRRTVVTTVAVALVVLLVAGFAFVNSSTMARVSRDARSLHWVDTVDGAATLALARADAAVTIAEIGGGVMESSVDDLEAVHEDLASLAAEDEESAVFPSLARFVGAVEAFLAELGDRDVIEARTLRGTSLHEAHSELTSALVLTRAALRESVDSGTGTAAGWIQFALVLAIPLCAAGAFYIISRRWVAAVESRSGRQLAEERETMRAVADFVTGVSRDMRSPLTSVYGFAHMMSRGEISGVEAMREAAQLIADDAADLKRTVDDFVVASGLDGAGVEVDPGPVRVGDVIERAVAPFEMGEVVIEREPTAAMATVDAALLEQVVTNLVANAVRHGGTEIGLGVTIGDGTVDIEVADNGRGLPDDRSAVILQRMSLDNPLLGDGAELGLAVAGRLARLMGGSVRYQRYTGRTYFVVTVPAAADEVAGELSVADMIKTLSA